jgi:hypothetical protein
VDYKKIASEIFNGPVSSMYVPVAKLKALSELAYCSMTSEEELKSDRMIGLGNILFDLACEFEELIEDAENKYNERNRPKAEEVQS